MFAGFVNIFEAVYHAHTHMHTQIQMFGEERLIRGIQLLSFEAAMIYTAIA